MSRVTARTRYGDRVAVVTVTYTSGEVLERFLDTLVKASSREVTVVLADNGSADGAPQRAARERENVRVLPTGGNLGYGTAANRGVAELDSSYGWVVIANPDLEWEPGSLDLLLEAAERWPQGGAFGPLIREADGSIYPSARSLPSLIRGAGHAVFADIWPNNPWTRAYLQTGREPRERAAGWLSGSCLLLRRQAFEDVDGFDERYFMYFEDVDLGERLGRAGWLNVYVPSAQVMHIHGHATSRETAAMLAAHHDSAYRYLAGRYSRPWSKPLLWLLRLGLALRLRVAMRKRTGHRAADQPSSR
ncbi:glycosyltransferase family 2 protein [Thermocrispum municipale]|jgi:N-acetylglucosaminyl-diphospho-decaprenol L-rhamnosyltransferase|uniref:glycosyltransferase family 2 protein n=1 Tax=Thermocrispum municipale TaxID=37926 RepID=UPI0006940C31